ncbi:hypothetical protein CCACVL1_10329, partial [Corchorus capsularis]
DERFLKEISTLKRKGAELMEENQQLKQQMEKISVNKEVVAEQSRPPESSSARAWSSATDPPPAAYNSSDISLRLG